MLSFCIFRSVSGRISCRSTSVTPKIHPKSSTLNSADLRSHNSTASSGSHILDTSQDNHLCSTRVETAEVHSDSSMSGSRSLGSPKLETARSHDGLGRDGTEPEGSGDDLDVPDHERGAQNELDTYNSHDNIFMSSANQNANDNDDNLSQASYNLHDEDDEGLHDKSAASDDITTQVLKSVRFIDEKPSPNSIHDSNDDITRSTSPIEGHIDTETTEQPVVDVCGQSSLPNVNASSPTSTGNESMSDIDMVCDDKLIMLDNGRLSDEVVSTPEDINIMNTNTNAMAVTVSNNQTDNIEVVDEVVPDNVNALNKPLVEDRPIRTEISGLSDVDNNNQQESEPLTPGSVTDVPDNAPLFETTCNGNVNNMVDNLVLPNQTLDRPVDFDDNSNLLENIPYILHRRRLQSDNDIKSETELYTAVATALRGGGLFREKSPTSPGYVLGREKSPSRMPNAHIEQLKFKADSPQLPGKRSPGAWSPGGWSPGSWSPLDRSPASRRRLELVNYHKLPAKDSFSSQDDTSNAHHLLIEAQLGKEKHRLDVSTINQINETKKQTSKFTLSSPHPPPERPTMTADKKKQGKEYSKLTAGQRFLPITKGFNIICLQSSSHSSQESSPVQHRHAFLKATFSPQDETASSEMSITSEKNNEVSSLEMDESKLDDQGKFNTVNEAGNERLHPAVEMPVPDSFEPMISSIDDLPPPPDDTDYNPMSCYTDLPDDSFLPPPPEEFIQDDEVLPPPPQDFDVPETFHVRDASLILADVPPVELVTAEKIIHFDESDDYPQQYERSTVTFSTFKPDDSPMRIDDNQSDILVTDASSDKVVCPKPRPLSTDSDRLGTIHEEIIVGGNALGGGEAKRHSIQSETDTPRRLSLLDDDSSLGDSQYYEESMDANDMLESLEGLDNRDTSSVTSSSLESEESSESSSDDEGGNAGIVQQLMARANVGDGNRNMARGKHEPSPVDPLEKLESLIEEEGEDSDGSSSMMGEGIDSSSSEESDIEDTPRQKRISIDPLEHLDHLDIIKVDYFSGESDTECGPQRMQDDTQTTTVPKLVVSRGSEDGRFITRDRNDAVSTEQSMDLQGGLALNLDRVVNNRSSREGLSPGSRSQDSSSDTTEPTDSSPAMSSPDSSHYLPYRSANNNPQASNPADEVYQNPYADSGIPVHLQEM